MKRILDLIYPKRCVFCDMLLPWGQPRWVCEYCNVEQWLLKKPRCRICSRPVEVDGAVCRSCLIHQIQTPGWSLFPYEAEVKASIHRFKYEGQKSYGVEYGYLLYQYAGFILEDAAALVPIPIHKDRMKERGYNQAQVMAEELGHRCGVRCQPLLTRVRKTTAQNALSAIGRRKNLEGAFAAKEVQLGQGDLILIDDIYTSGSTVEEAALVLKKAYPNRRIRFLTLAMANSKANSKANGAMK